MIQDDALQQAEALVETLAKRLHATPEYRAWQIASNMVTLIRSGNADVEAVPGGFAVNPRPPRRLKLKRVSQGDAAERALREANRPMTTAEIVEAIKAKGAKVGGQDPLINVSSTLSKDERFLAMRQGQSSVWTLANPGLDFGGETGADTPAAD